MYYVYILKSKKNGKYYIGSTEDLEPRIIRHNSGKSNFTKKGIPWILIYNEQFNNRNDAHAREMKIKSYKGGAAFKKLIG